MKTYRQGDVLLVPIAKPYGLSRGKLEKRIRERGESASSIILAAGEATGHHHRIRDRHSRVRALGGRRILTVSKRGAQLTHEEHKTIDLPKGDYEVVQQSEYVPAIKENKRPERRRVFD